MAHKTQTETVMMRIILICLLFEIILAQDKGQSLYQKGKYDEARAYYENILQNRKNDPSAQFDLGVTAYQQKDYETSVRNLNAVLNAEDKSLASKAHYNIGNLFREQQKLEDGAAFYRKAIELDPSDEDAKVNFELLKRQLQNQEQKQDQQSNQDQNSENQQNKDQQSSQDKDSKTQQEEDQKLQEQSSENQAQKDSQDQEQSEQERDQAKQDVQNQEEQLNPVEKQEEKTDKQIQAEAILNALKDQEKINQKRQIARTKFQKMEKDW
jgi:Ca-activated chloride channel family protein